MKVVIYSKDNAAIVLLRALLDNKAEVILPERSEPLELGHLVIVDYGYPKSLDVLNRVRQADDSAVVAVMSFNPFVITQVMLYNIDAILLKPLQAESIQALLVGVQARAGG